MVKVGINLSSSSSSSLVASVPETVKKETQAGALPTSKFHHLNQWAAKFREKHAWGPTHRVTLLDLAFGRLTGEVYDPNFFPLGTVESEAHEFLKEICRALIAPDKFNPEHLNEFLESIETAEPKNLFPVLLAALELVHYLPLLNPTRYRNIDPVRKFLTEEVASLNAEQLENSKFILTPEGAVPNAAKAFPAPDFVQVKPASGIRFNWKTCAVALAAIAAIGAASYGIVSYMTAPLASQGGNLPPSNPEAKPSVASELDQNQPVEPPSETVISSPFTPNQNQPVTPSPETVASTSPTTKPNDSTGPLAEGSRKSIHPSVVNSGKALLAVVGGS